MGTLRKEKELAKLEQKQMKFILIVLLLTVIAQPVYPFSCSYVLILHRVPFSIASVTCEADCPAGPHCEEGRICYQGEHHQQESCLHLCHVLGT